MFEEQKQQTAKVLGCICASGRIIKLRIKNSRVVIKKFVVIFAMVNVKQDEIKII